MSNLNQLHILGITPGMSEAELKAKGWTLNERQDSGFLTYSIGEAGYSVIVENEEVVEVLGQALERNGEILIKAGEFAGRNRKMIFDAIGFQCDLGLLESFELQPPKRINIESWGLAIFFIQNVISLICLYKDASNTLRAYGSFLDTDAD